MTGATKFQFAKTLSSPGHEAEEAPDKDASVSEQVLSSKHAEVDDNPGVKFAGPDAASDGASDGTEPPGAGGECLSDNELFDYASGRSSKSKHAYIHAHLDACETCQTLVYVAVQHWDSPSPSDASGVARITTFTCGYLVSARYRIDRFVAKSGMGEVYEAFDTLRRKRVALKTVLCTASDDPRAVRALTSEVEHALLVSHPNVCRVYELGEHRNDDSGEPSVRFLTMEFVDGTTLGQRIRAGPIPIAELRSIALQLLAGLNAAHTKGVLHLDLKSDNVMLRGGSAPTEALIMDFGLSRTRTGESALHASEQELRGTPGYMAPEQLECTTTSRATDVYSFGTVMFEMLVGTLPFRADTLSALLVKQIRSRPPPPSQFRPELSRALDEFVLKCLHRNPDKRYSDAASALAALQRIDVWTNERATPNHRRALIGAVVGLPLVMSALWLARARAPALPTPFAAPIDTAPQAMTAPREESLPEPPSLPEQLDVPLAAKEKRATALRPATATTTKAGGDSTNAATPRASAEDSDARAWKRVPVGGFWIPESEPAAADAEARDYIPLRDPSPGGDTSINRQNLGRELDQNRP